jgi:hypothetical protein
MNKSREIDKQSIATTSPQQSRRIVAKRRTSEELFAEVLALYAAAAAYAENHLASAKARHDIPSANFWIREMAAMKKPIVVWPEPA